MRLLENKTPRLTFLSPSSYFDLEREVPSCESTVCLSVCLSVSLSWRGNLGKVDAGLDGAAVDTFPIHFLEALWQRGGRGGATSLPRAAGGAKRGAARKQLAMSVGAVSLALAAARDAAVEWH